VRLFVESREKINKEPHRGIEPWCDLILASVSGVAVTGSGDAVTDAVTNVVTDAVTCVLGGDVHSHTTFSIFFWFQVANFDVFLFLVLHVCYLSFAGLFVLCVVSVAPNSN
jgi:hypothetical protein